MGYWVPFPEFLIWEAWDGGPEIPAFKRLPGGADAAAWESSTLELTQSLERLPHTLFCDQHVSMHFLLLLIWWDSLLSPFSEKWISVLQSSTHPTHLQGQDKGLLSEYPTSPLSSLLISSVQSLSHVWLFPTLWTAARQASLSITNSQSLLKLMSIKPVMPSNHLILCHPLLLLPLIFSSIRVFSNESTLHIRWPKQSIEVSASASVLPMNTQDWSPLGWTGWISLQSKRHSGVFSNTTVQKPINSSVLSFLYSPILTSIHDYWKNVSHRCIEQSFRLCGRRRGWDVSREQHRNVYYLGWNRSPAQVGCMRQVLRPGALGRPRGIRWKGGEGGGRGDQDGEHI